MNIVLLRLQLYAQLMRVDKPVGTILLMWPMLWALWLAGSGQPPANIVLIFLLGAFITRSAGCVINDIADRKFDLAVTRTQNRVLARGQIQLPESLLVLVTLTLMALGLLSLLPHTVWPYALFAFGIAIFYPFSKRFFPIPQFFLGLAFSSAILMVFAALATVGLTAWLVFITSSVWALIYDTFYAMVDREDDKHLPIHSSALLLAQHDLRFISCMMLAMLGLLLLLGLLRDLNGFYYLSLLLVGLCFIYQLALTRQRDQAACFSAFLNNQWVGMLIFAGIVLNYLP